jgi:hypothetical protein
VVVPPAAGLDAALDIDVSEQRFTMLAPELPVLGSRDVGFSVTPAAPLCVLALDGGSAGSPLFGGYARLAPDAAWDPARGFGWVGGAPQSRDRGGLDALRRDFCNDTATRTLRVAVPPGPHPAFLLVGDAAVGARPTIVASEGIELGRSRDLGTAEFQWLSFTLDGGPSGRAVDVELSGVGGEHWRLVAFALVDPDASPPPVVIGDVTPGSLLLLEGEPVEARFWLYNFTDADARVEPRVTVPPGYSATTEASEVVVPGGGDRDVVVTVTRNPGPPKPGELVLALDGDRRTVPLEPTDNWARIATMSASSSHAPSSPANLNDGDTDPNRWGGGGANGWNDDTPGVFPDSATAAWEHPIRLGRVAVHTLDSAAFPAARWGVRDVDVEVRTNGAWRTVAQVRANTRGVVECSFGATEADALRVVVLDSNDHTYSRLIEIEAYSS